MCDARIGIRYAQSLRWWCKAIVVASSLVVCSLTPVQADTSDAEFDARVRAYLLANPEIILQALEILSQREARAAMVAKLALYPELFIEPPVLGLGPKDAALTVVEFFDYRCAPCKFLHPKLKIALNAHPDIRVEMRHLPILSPGSERGARFALAVRNTASAQVYGAVHEDIWAIKGPLRAAAFERIAAAHGLEWGSIKAEMDSEAVSARIARNRDIAIDLEILGTPAFVTPSSVSFGGTDADALIEGWLNR